MLPFLFFVLLILFSWLVLVWFAFLYARNLFVKKNWFAVVLITLFYYTTDVYPYQPTYRGFVCTHLFLFVIICENLFFLRESFLYVRIFSYLWSSVGIYYFIIYLLNKLVYEFPHRKQFFYHQNTIVIFCWFRVFQVYVFCFQLSSFCVWVLFC